MRIGTVGSVQVPWLTLASCRWRLSPRTGTVFSVCGCGETERV